MQTGISDTNSKAEEFLYSLMRNTGPAEKMSRIHLAAMIKIDVFLIKDTP